MLLTAVRCNSGVGMHSMWRSLFWGNRSWHNSRNVKKIRYRNWAPICCCVTDYLHLLVAVLLLQHGVKLTVHCGYSEVYSLIYINFITIKVYDFSILGINHKFNVVLVFLFVMPWMGCTIPTYGFWNNILA